MTHENLYMMTLPRSGSTLFGQHLGQHTNVFHVGESMYWEMLDPKDTKCSCGQTNCDFLGKVAEEIANSHAALPLLKVWQVIDRRYWPNKKTYSDSVIQENDEVPNEDSLDYWLSLAPLALEQVVDAYRKHSPKQIYLDNTKLFNIAEKLLSQSDKWGVIALIRDPRGIMSSFKNAGVRKGDFRKAQSVLPFCLDFMKSVDQNSGNEKLLIVRYEDFCANPKQVLSKVCSFVGVEFEDVMLRPINSSLETRGHVLKGNHLLKSVNLISIEEDKSWQENLTPEELSSFYENEELVNLYSKFGYNFKT